jgi:hypothetical protein
MTFVRPANADVYKELPKTLALFTDEADIKFVAPNFLVSSAF